MSRIIKTSFADDGDDRTLGRLADALEQREPELRKVIGQPENPDVTPALNDGQEWISNLPAMPPVPGPNQKTAMFMQAPDLSVVLRGGPGSGHFGHAGRPGEIGGSAPGDFHSGESRPEVDDEDLPDIHQKEWEETRRSYGERLARDYGVADWEGDWENAIWIASDGKMLAPHADHQETAMVLLGWHKGLELFSEEYSDKSMLATNTMVEAGLVRYNISEGELYFDIPSIDETTDEQWTTMSAMVSRIGQDIGRWPNVHVHIGGPFLLPLSLGMGPGGGGETLTTAKTYDYLGFGDETPGGEFVFRGGPGSGHFGHKGIPEHRGGSQPGDFHSGETGKTEGKKRVGITSSRPGKPNAQVFEEMRQFKDRLLALPSVANAEVEPGLGGWQDESGQIVREPTWVVSYEGNGEAQALLEETAKLYEQDAVLVMGGTDGEDAPMSRIVFGDNVTPEERDAIQTSAAEHGFAGWTWYRDEQGRAVMELVTVPQWGGDVGKHVLNAAALSNDIRAIGQPSEISNQSVKVSVVETRKTMEAPDLHEAEREAEVYHGTQRRNAREILRSGLSVKRSHDGKVWAATSRDMARDYGVFASDRKPYVVVVIDRTKLGEPNPPTEFDAQYGDQGKRSWSQDIPPEAILRVEIWANKVGGRLSEEPEPMQVLLPERSAPSEVYAVVVLTEEGYDVVQMPSGAVERSIIGLTSRLVVRGGPGSGHFGHEGRPGQRGGSQPDDFHSAESQTTREEGNVHGFYRLTTEELNAEREKYGVVYRKDKIRTNTEGFVKMAREGPAPDLKAVNFGRTFPSKLFGVGEYIEFEFEDPKKNVYVQMGEEDGVSIATMEAINPGFGGGTEVIHALRDWTDLSSGIMDVWRITNPKFFKRFNFWTKDEIGMFEGQSARYEKWAYARQQGVEQRSIVGLTRRLVVRGGPGSGHFGHSGRPGEVGGSTPSDFHSAQKRRSYPDDMQETRRRIESLGGTVAWSKGDFDKLWDRNAERRMESRLSDFKPEDREYWRGHFEDRLAKEIRTDKGRDQMTIAFEASGGRLMSERQARAYLDAYERLLQDGAFAESPMALILTPTPTEEELDAFVEKHPRRGAFAKSELNDGAAGKYLSYMRGFWAFDYPDIFGVSGEKWWDDEHKARPSTWESTERAAAISLYSPRETGVLLHEYGHHLSSDDRFPSAWKASQQLLSTGSGDISAKNAHERPVSENISFYATTNRQELVAECYAMSRHPDYEAKATPTQRGIINFVLNGGPAPSYLEGEE